MVSWWGRNWGGDDYETVSIERGGGSLAAECGHGGLMDGERREGRKGYERGGR